MDPPPGIGIVVAGVVSRELGKHVEIRQHGDRNINDTWLGP
jgi:hypothetical protein